MDFFLLIPESTWAKLFSSLMGGAVNCLLDVLPALLLAAVIVGENPLTALAWLPFIVSVDLYATCVGTFINLSVPGKAGTTLKQMVQVMFIYFGLLPDAALIAVGMVMGWAAPAAVAAAVLNTVLGLLFFGLTPLFLEPGAAREKRRADREAAADPSALPAARRAFSRMGFGTALVLVLGSALQLALIRFLPKGLGDTWWYLWAVTFAPLYLVSFPLGALIIRKVPAHRGERVSPGPGQLLSLIPICVFFMLAGNYMGVAVNWLIGKLPGAATVNPVEAYALQDDIWMKLLFLTVCAPVMEELLFRRMLIDRMRPYGERLAVVTSAAMFGLFHGNISQFFYAFLLGLVFGYVYLRTGKLRYTAALHMFINFIGSIVGPAVMGRAESAPAQGISPWQLVYAGYAALLMLAGLSGLVLYLIRRREVHFDPAPLELPREKRLGAVWGNPGMLVLAAVCLAVFCVNIFGL
jgi:membrane protease YdiL (CAAX protease family)